MYGYFGEDNEKTQVVSQINQYMNDLKAQLKVAWFGHAKAVAALTAAQFEQNVKTQFWTALNQKVNNEARNIVQTSPNFGYQDNNASSSMNNIIYYLFLKTGPQGYATLRDDVTFTSGDDVNSYLDNEMAVSTSGTFQKDSMYAQYVQRLRDCGMDVGAFAFSYRQEYFNKYNDMAEAGKKVTQANSIVNNFENQLLQIKQNVDQIVNSYRDYQTQYGDIGLKDYNSLLNEIKNEPEIVEAPQVVKEAIAISEPVVAEPENITATVVETQITEPAKKSSAMPLIIGGLAVAAAILGSKN